MSDHPDEMSREWQETTLGHHEFLRASVRTARRQRLVRVLTWVYLAICFASSLALLRSAFAVTSILGWIGAVAFIGTLVWMGLTYRRQQTRLAGLIIDGPSSAIDALIAHAHAERYWWIGRGPLTASLVIVASAACLILPPWLASRDTPQAGAWQSYIEQLAGMVVFLVVILVPLAAWRLRVLRRRIAAWRSMAAELASDAD